MTKRLIHLLAALQVILALCTFSHIGDRQDLANANHLVMAIQVAITQIKKDGKRK